MAAPSSVERPTIGLSGTLHDALQAARKGDVAGLRLLRDKGCRFNYAVLQAAAGEGELEAVAFLCAEAGGLDRDFDLTDDERREDLIAFHRRAGHEEIVRSLEIKVPRHLTPTEVVLREALDSGHFATADYLLAHGGRLSKVLVLEAVCYPPALRYLREKRCPRGWGAVLAAAAFGRMASLKILCGEGVAGAVSEWGKRGPAIEIAWPKKVVVDRSVRECLEYLFAAGFTFEDLLEKFEAKLAKVGWREGDTEEAFAEVRERYRGKYRSSARDMYSAARALRQAIEGMQDTPMC